MFVSVGLYGDGSAVVLRLFFGAAAGTLMLIAGGTSLC